MTQQGDLRPPENSSNSAKVQEEETTYALVPAKFQKVGPLVVELIRKLHDDNVDVEAC
jgi:hypothetical protein